MEKIIWVLTLGFLATLCLKIALKGIQKARETLLKRQIMRTICENKVNNENQIDESFLHKIDSPFYLFVADKEKTLTSLKIFNENHSNTTIFTKLIGSKSDNIGQPSLFQISERHESKYGTLTIMGRKFIVVSKTNEYDEEIYCLSPF